MIRYTKSTSTGRSQCQDKSAVIRASTSLLAGGALTTLVLFSPETRAQSQEVALEQVVVTAQKRRESIQEVPISAQVLSAQTLAQQNINSLVDVAQITPSLHIGISGRTNELYIRGIGSGANQSFDQSVGVFIDDIYHGRSRSSAMTFIDLERVEVLKGPQSTFFGNNAIAGALSIVTQKPTPEYEGFARGLYGQD